MPEESGCSWRTGWTVARVLNRETPVGTSRMACLIRVCISALLVLSLIGVTPGHGKEDPGPELAISWDVDAARVGDTVVLTLTYRLPEGGEVPEDVVVRGLEGLTVLQKKVAPGEIQFSLLVDRLESFTTGPLELPYLDADGETRVLTGQPEAVQVLSNLGARPDEAELKGIRGIIPTRPVWPTYLVWIAGLLFLLLATVAVIWWRRHRRSVNHLNAELLDPPHVRARKALDRLGAGDLYDRGRIKAYYFRLSEVLRQYLGAIRGFAAAEMTTEEIAARIDLDVDRELLRLLREGDMVKFADVVPTPARKAEHMRRAFAYIDATTPDDEGVPSGSGGGEEKEGSRMRGDDPEKGRQVKP